MADKKNAGKKQLIEQMVRNDDIFCSLLYDEQNSTLRVVDFRGGNFQQKQDYLKRIQLAEGFRKIFTLIERDDMQGWQRSGYQKEGTIPGYYRRSDAYVMGWLADENWQPVDQEEETEEKKEYINKVRTLAEEYETYSTKGYKAESVTLEEVSELLKAEQENLTSKSKSKKAKTIDYSEIISSLQSGEPLFMQFSRGVEYYYYSVLNKRTKQGNIFSAEYQDCFGNAKIDFLYSNLKNKIDISLARFGLQSFVDWLAEIGAVAIFSLVDSDNIPLNAVFASAGFKNSGWLCQQVVDGKSVKDQILWTTKLLV